MIPGHLNRPRAGGLLLLCAALGCGGSIRESHFNRGVGRQKDHLLAAAARSYRRAIEEDPKSALAHYNLGTVYHELGKLKKARTSYEKALTLRTDPRAHINLAAIFEQEGRHPQALAQLELAAKADDESAYTVCYRGFFHERRGDLEKAEADYRAGMEREPEDPFCYLRMGKLLWKKGQTEEAFDSLHEAVRLDPGFAVAWKTLGELSRESQRTAGAIRAYERVATLEPDEAEHRVVLGSLYLQRGDPRRAAEALWKAHTLAPRDERLHGLLLEVYVDLLSAGTDAAIEKGGAEESLDALREKLNEIQERIISAREASTK